MTGEAYPAPAAVTELAVKSLVGAWFVGAVLSIAVGVSGIVAGLFGTFAGARFVSGDAPGVTYTPERCADYFEYVPTASTCADAAALHHLGEVEDYRIAVGVLGLLALLVLWAARRFTVLGRPSATPPAGTVIAVLFALFAAVAVLLGGVSLMELVFGQTSGVGADLSAGLVSGVAALANATYVIVRVRRGAHGHLPQP
jgi:hypothetical protein